MFDYISKKVFIVTIAVVFLLAVGGFGYLYNKVENISEQEMADIVSRSDLDAVITSVGALEEGDVGSAHFGIRLNNLKEDVEALKSVLESRQSLLDNLEEEISGLKLRMGQLEVEPVVDDVLVNAMMISPRTIEAADDYAFKVTMTNLTSEYVHVALKAVFTSRTHNATVNIAQTRMFCEGYKDLMFYESFTPGARGCVAMEIANDLPGHHFSIPAQSSITRTVVLHLVYIEGVSEWDYSFDWKYNW